MDPYSKPALTHTEQVDLLASRGLIIKDRPKAEQFLSQVNYYRFSAYCLPFEASRHHFESGATFERIQQLYEFDRCLRFLIDEALEIIEISVRTAISYHLVHKYGAFVHEDPTKFYAGFEHAEWIEQVHKEITRSKETFIAHYKKKYEGFPRLPLWMAVEVMSFGALSQLYKNMMREDQVALGKTIGFHFTVLSSWLHTFSYTRNICAHHSRVWNRDLSIALITPKNGRWDGINAKRIGSVIFAINYFLSKMTVEPRIKKEWHTEIGALLSKPVDIANFYQSIGLPENFKKHPLWKMP